MSHLKTSGPHTYHWVLRHYSISLNSILLPALWLSLKIKTLIGATTRLLATLTFLYCFPSSAGWTDDSLVRTAQTLASSTRLTERWVCLPRAKSVIDHRDPFVHPVKDFSRVPEGKWFSTENPRLSAVMYRVRIVLFPAEENSTISCLTLPLAREGKV